MAALLDVIEAASGITPRRKVIARLLGPSASRASHVLHRVHRPIRAVVRGTTWRRLLDTAYEISDPGECRRAEPDAQGRYAGNILRPHIGHKSYRSFFIAWPDGRRSLISAGRAMLLAWVGPPPTPEHQAAYDDGDVTNIVVSNLKWKTAVENAFDKLRHGTHLFGSSIGTAKINENDVQEIDPCGWWRAPTAMVCRRRWFT